MTYLTKQYRIVPGERATVAEVNAAMELRNYFSEVLGISVTITDDWDRNPNRSDYSMEVSENKCFFKGITINFR